MASLELAAARSFCSDWEKPNGPEAALKCTKSVPDGGTMEPMAWQNRGNRPAE
jgi:hypothetical protein